MKKHLIFISILLLALSGTMFAGKIHVFKELMQPNRIYIDAEIIYITERTTVFIYSLQNYSFIQKFGGNGEGPGEFKVPLFLIPIRDRLLINSLGKISYFTKQGKLIEEVKNESGTGFFFPLGDGFAGDQYTETGGIRYFTVSYFDSRLRKGRELYREQIPIQQPGKIELFRRAFMHRTYKNRLYVTGREGFVMDCLNPNGEFLFTIEKKNFRKHKITAEDIRNADKYFRIRYGDSYEDIKNRISYPDYFPEIRAFYLVDDKIYILPYEWKSDALKFYIYDLNGKPIAERFIPLAMKYSMQPYPFAIWNNRIYQLIENETSEEWELHITDLKF